jgi:hypothetical protein
MSAGIPYDIVPLTAVGQFRFGSPRKLVEQSIAQPSLVRPATKYSRQYRYTYSRLGIHLYYLDEILVGIELFSPAWPTFEAVPLINRNPRDVVADLRARGHSFRVEQPSYVFDDLCISLYAPGKETENDCVEGVSAFWRKEDM